MLAIAFSSCPAMSPTENTSEDMIQLDTHLFVNIRGIRYRLSREALERATCYYGAFASKFDSSNANFDKQTGEFYYDRNPWLFAYIWDYFATGESHFPREVCLNGLRRELDFWGLDDDIFGGCCWERLEQHRESEKATEELKIQWYKYDIMATKTSYDPPTKSGGCSKPKRNQNLRLFLENPDSSKAARVCMMCIVCIYFILYLVCILS